MEKARGYINRVVTLCTTKLNIQKFYILTTKRVYEFFMELGNYFSMRH